MSDIKSIIWSPYSQALEKSAATTSSTTTTTSRNRSTTETTTATSSSSSFRPNDFALRLRTRVVRVLLGMLKREDLPSLPLRVKWQLFPAAVQLVYQELHYRMELGGIVLEDYGTVPYRTEAYIYIYNIYIYIYS